MQKQHLSKYFVLFLFLVIFMSTANAQFVRLSYGSGLGTYSMNTIKGLNQYAIQKLPFPAKVTDNFPATFYHEVTLALSIERFGVGFSYGYNTTGSRTSYKDYSGQYTDDLSLAADLPSLFINFIAIRRKVLDVELQTKAGAILTNINNKTSVKVGEELTVDELYVTSDSWFVSPLVSFVYKPLRIVNIGFNAGYLYDFEGEIKKDGDMKFVNPESKKAIKTNWSGLRVGFSLMVNIQNLFK